MKIKKSTSKKIIITTFLVTSMFVGGAYQKSQSASLTSVSSTLSNSRLSFNGALTTGNTAGSSQVLLETTTGDYHSTTSAQLVSGDTVSIGDTNNLADYTVTSIDSAGVFNVTPVLIAANADNDDAVISTQSATHTVRFTTANAIPNGRFRVLVPSEDSDADAADGIPDSGQFDFGNSAPTVTCPGNVVDAGNDGFTFTTGAATASAITVGAQQYHSYECAYSGSGTSASPSVTTSFDAITINSIINPAPKLTHSTGAADTYKIIVQHLDDTFTVRDSTTVSIGVVEAVRVTATVAPQITFQISGIASGTTACGQTTDITTTAAAVPLGELSISAFTDAAQALSVSTNAANGYVVTALANDQMGRNAGTCSGDNTGANCIPDSVGDTTTMTHTTADEWVTATVNGFGFSLDDINTSGLTAPFEYDSSAGGCAGTYCSRQFADNENVGVDSTQIPQTIFSATTVADEHNLYVCYRATISSTQSAGEYENNITYTATATF